MADLPSLQRATESTDAPTPGYLYQDIAKSVASSPVANAETVTYLSKRLTSKGNHNVKYKTLKVIQMVSSNSITRGQFKRVVCQDLTCVTAIKECLNYRGPPDPVHGDEIYSRVRNQAKETLDAIYSDTPSTEQAPFNNPISSNTTAGSSTSGYSISGGGVSGNPGMPGPKKMDGIGNPMFKDPRQYKESSNSNDLGTMTISDVFSAAKEGFTGIIKDTLAGRQGTSDKNSGGYYSNSGGNNYSGVAPPGSRELATATQGQWTMASNRGPNSYGSSSSSAYSNGPTNPTVSIHSGVGGSWGITGSTGAAPTVSTSQYTSNGVVSGPGGAASSNGSYEKNLIMELCPPGGISAEPPVDKLQQFIPVIPSLNPDLVCPALLDALEEGQPWIIRAKALCVMDVVIKVAEQNRGPGQNNAYSDFFHACKEEIEPLANHNRAAIRDPARRVLKAMGLESQQDLPKFNPTLTPTVATDLLDFNSAPQSNPIVVQPSPTVSMSTPLDNLPATSANLKTDIFGGMIVKPTSISTSPSSASTMTDLLGTPNAESVEAVLESSSKPGSIGDISIRASDHELLPTEPGNKVSTSSSAFSFIDGGNSDANSALSARSLPMKENPSRESFDPLLTLSATPNTSSSAPLKTPIFNNASVMPSFQNQQQMMQMQMNLMHITSSNNNPVPLKSPSMSMNPNPSLMSSAVMGGSKGGVATSFAFFEDPAKTMKLAQEAKAKKFDFVQDAMKEAKH